MSNMEKEYFVYQHLTPEGMYYFGVTDNLKRRFRPSAYKSTSLKPHIDKYGWDNIKHIVLFSNQTYEDARFIEDFLINTATMDGVCINKRRSGLVSKNDLYHRKYRNDHKDVTRDYNKQYNEKNKEELKIKKREYYDNNRNEILDYHKKYYDDNIEKIKDYQKQYRNKNIEKIKQYRKDYYEKNKDKIKSKNRDFYKKKKMETDNYAC